MIVGHCSDTHGFFPELPKDAETVIHCGDLLPNASRGNLHIELPYQERWLRHKIPTFKEWLEGRDLLFCSGNHDFISNVAEIFQEHGINAINLNDQLVSYKGFTFYGFPYINYICGEWNFETSDEQMEKKVRQLKDVLLYSSVDILAAHAPIYNLLDADIIKRDGAGNIVMVEGNRYGVKRLADLFSFDLPEEQLPKFYLHGHVHSHYGRGEIGTMQVYNSATIVQRIDLKPTS